MKAIRVHQFGGPEVPQVEEVQSASPGPGTILIRVRAAGVNPYDTYMRSGAYGARNPALPYTPGSNAAGTIEALGPDANRFKTGDRVFTTGTVTGANAEHCRVEQVQKLPEGVSYIRMARASTFHTLPRIARFSNSRMPSGGIAGWVSKACHWIRNALASAPEAHRRVMETSASGKIV